MIRITECPRDAMQGIKDFIPTRKKAVYINSLLKCGFDVIDFGSFVSAKAIPQMQDTAEVLKQLELDKTRSKLLAIVANERGAGDACSFEEISYLGFPFSISETFQQRNTNSSIIESLKRVEAIQNLCKKNKKELVVYISMAFGNPYGDEWDPEIAANWCRKLQQTGIRNLALADTVGSSTPETITSLFGMLIPEFQEIDLGAHLHSTSEKAREKIHAAYSSGCRNFDVALYGFGGCPMATDKLTGNLATQQLLEYVVENQIETQLDLHALNAASKESLQIFNQYH